MKILQINSARRWIGEAQHTLLLSRELIQAGHEVKLIVRQDWELEKKAKHENLPYEALHFNSRFHGLKDLQDLMNLKIILEDFQPDIIHCHRGKDHWALLTGRNLFYRETPIVRTRHVMVPAKNHILNRWLYMKQTAKIICVSSQVARQFDGWKAKKDHISVIHAGIDTALYYPEQKSPYRDQFQIPKDAILIGNVGRFQRIKGQIHFLKAAKRLISENPNVFCYLAGRDKGLRKDFRNYISEHNLQKRCFILDTIQDMPALIADTDIGVISSIGSEGSSRILLEFMASATPVVSTDVGGIPDLMPEHQRPYMIPPANSDLLYDKLNELINSKSICDNLGNQNLSHIQKKHTLKTWVNNHLELYKELL